MKRFLTRRITGPQRLGMAAWILCGLTVTAFLGRWGWWLDLTAHFRVQYFWGLVLLIGPLLWARKRLTAAICLACLILNAVEIYPVFITPKPHPGLQGARVRLLLANVMAGNPQRHLARELIKDEAADIVVLQEVDAQWLADLDPVLRAYPHRRVVPRPDNFGIALFSRLALETADVLHLGDAELPSILARINIAGRSLSILATHPLPPVGRESSRRRDGQLAAVAAMLKDPGNSRILVGDLNATPWSHAFKQLRQTTGLVNSGAGIGLHASWPAGFLPLRIPIDHCLHSPDLITLRKTTGRTTGSDHLPLRVELLVPMHR